MGPFSDEEIAVCRKNWRQELMEYIERIDAMIPAAQFGFLGRTFDAIRGLAEVSRTAESPIEALLGMYLVDLPDLIPQLNANYYCEMRPQEVVKLAGKTYRVDFLVWLWDHREGLQKEIIIECDGHDFHERTKEQARKDKERDRAFVAAGYLVLRFTGSEIWKDPNGCSHEITRLIKNLLI